MTKRGQHPEPHPKVTPASQAVGRVFYTARTALRLTQEEVADLMAGQPARVSRTMISFIENGRSLPGLESVVSLCTVLHVDPAEIMELVRISAPPPPDAQKRDLDELQSVALKHFWAGEYREALAIYDVMLERLNEQSAEDARQREARIEINRAAALRRSGALRAAQSTAERAVAISTGFVDLHPEAYVVLSAILAERALYPLALDCSARAVDLASKSNDQVRARAVNQRGDVLYAVGDYEAAGEAFQRALALARTARDVPHEIKALGNSGACLLATGDHDAAAACFDEAVQLARKHNEPRSEAFWLLESARGLFAAEQYAQADTRAREALRVARPLGFDLITFRCEWLRHRVVKHDSPDEPDRHRIAFLRRLFPRLRAYHRVPELRDFRHSILKESTS